MAGTKMQTMANGLLHARVVTTLLRNQTMFMTLFLVGMCAVFAQASPYFFTKNNLLSITVQASVICMIAAGQTFVILSGGIDLGCGSIVALAAVMAAMVMEHTDLMFPGFAVGIAVGAGCGVFNGLVIGKLRLAPFVSTLGMMGIARGLALIVSHGLPQYKLAAGSDVLGQGSIQGLPMPTIVVFVLYALCHAILTRTKRGRYTYAVGSNPQATMLCGISLPRQLVWVYTIAGITAGLAGITELSRVGSGQPGAGADYALDSIAAVVLGGTSLQGGVGNIWGTLIGGLIIATLRNGLNVLNINAHWQQVTIGVILIIAVYADRVHNEMRK
jgi:ribose/xylose/arabinose/galactoside ABC-type transport system permease subunit